jgi:hypothetical protein
VRERQRIESRRRRKQRTHSCVALILLTASHPSQAITTHFLVDSA